MAECSRLTRSMASYLVILDSQVQILSATEGNTAAQHRAAVAKAEASGNFISKSTTEGMWRRKQARRAGSLSLAARESGAHTNYQRAQANAEPLVDLIRPLDRLPTVTEMLELATRHGLRSPSGRFYTRHTIARPYRRAKTLLEGERAMEASPKFGLF